MSDVVYVMLPDQVSRIAAHLSNDAVRLWVDVLAYERQNPQPQEHHLTVLAADIGRAYFGPRDVLESAIEELLGCGWWQARGARMYVGGPPEISSLLWSKDRLDEKRDAGRERVRKHRASKRAASEDHASEPDPLTALSNQTKPNQGNALPSTGSEHETGAGRPRALPACCPDQALTEWAGGLRCRSCGRTVA